jgi:hypothetical protein
MDLIMMLRKFASSSIYSFNCLGAGASSAAVFADSNLSKMGMRNGSVLLALAVASVLALFLLVPVVAENGEYEKNGDQEKRAGSLNDSAIPRFQLRTYHDEIWSPINSNSILPGYAVKDKAKNFEGTPTFLHGKITFSPSQSSLQVIQHFSHSRMFGNLIRENALFDHDFLKDLNSQLAQNRPKLDAEISDAEKEMKFELSKSVSAPSPSSLAQTAMKAPAQELKPNLDLQLRRATPKLESELSIARREMEEQLAQVSKTETPIIFGTGTMKVKVSKIDLDDREPSDNARAELENEMALAQQDMQEQLTGRRISAPVKVSNEIKSQLAHGRFLRDAQMAEAKKELAAVYMTMRRPPQLATEAQLRTIDRSGDAAALERLISWDNWYAKVAKASEAHLLKSLAKYGSPSGINTIAISVWPNHRLQAHIVKSSNSRFDNATLEAYRTLDGDSILQFPDGSRREVIKFLVDNKHHSQNAVSSVDSQSCTGDNEVQVIAQ